MALALIISVALAIGSERAQPLRLESVSRSDLTDGVELLRSRVVAGGLFRGQMVVLYVDLNTVNAHVELNEEKKPLYDLLKDAIAVANAGYFTREFKPTGLLINDGKVLHPFIKKAGGAGSGVLVAKNGRVRLLERDEVKPNNLKTADLAIQAGPRVIEPDGSPGIHGDDGNRANRTVIGYDGQGRLALAIIYSSDAGMGTGLTLFELQTVLGHPQLANMEPNLSFRAALNLDGGPSTGLHVSAEPPHNFAPASPVLSILRIKKKAPDNSQP